MKLLAWCWLLRLNYFCDVKGYYLSNTMPPSLQKRPTEPNHHNNKDDDDDNEADVVMMMTTMS